MAEIGLPVVEVIEVGIPPEEDGKGVGDSGLIPILSENELVCKISNSKDPFTQNGQFQKFLPIMAAGGTFPRLTKSRTMLPPDLISSMASAWVMFLVLTPLISTI